MSEASVSPNSSVEEWGEDDPAVSTVLGGRPVWLLALHQLVMARDHWAYLERCLVQVDFIAMPLEVRSVGTRFLEDVRESTTLIGPIAASPPTRLIEC